ncbi:MAG TPA: hypothetical protein DIW61_10240 [Candidatus Aminicenantes bacterium]|nr:hypothetical protein [Candidatus Aminicenantes bacterium]
MLSDISSTICWRLLDREKKTPRMRKDRQMMVMDRRFRALYCQRLLWASRRKYLIFWRMGGPPCR